MLSEGTVGSRFCPLMALIHLRGRASQLRDVPQRLTSVAKVSFGVPGRECAHDKVICVLGRKGDLLEHL